LQHLLSELRVEKLERLFQALEKSTSKQLENLKDLIRAYYKASGTTMDIDLSKKGLKQLEYIYQDIYNTLSSSNNGLEGKLYFLKNNEDTREVISAVYNNISTVRSSMNSWNNYKNGRIYNNAIDEYKEEVSERLDIILNGNLSYCYNKYNDSRHKIEKEGKPI